MRMVNICGCEVCWWRCSRARKDSEAWNRISKDKFDHFKSKSIAWRSANKSTIAIGKICFEGLKKFTCEQMQVTVLHFEGDERLGKILSTWLD